MNVAVRPQRAGAMLSMLAVLAIAAPAAAQWSAPPSAPEFHRHQAPVLSAGASTLSFAPALGTDASLTQDALPKSRLQYSIPASLGLGIAGMLVGYGTGMVALDCEDSGVTCGTGPENSEYKLAAVGLALGSAAGAHLAGRRATSRGDWWLTLAAAAAGALPLVLTDPADNEGIILGSTGLSIGAAVLADHLVRRPR